MKVFCLNNISKEALNTINQPDVVVDDINNADSILVRSFKMHDYELPKNVIAVARAGAGVNNIPLEKYAEEGVVYVDYYYHVVILLVELNILKLIQMMLILHLKQKKLNQSMLVLK